MIRVATPADAAAIAAIYAPYVEETWISFEEVPPDADEMQSRLTAGLQTHPWLVSENAGMVEGYAHAGAHKTRAAYRWSVDSTVYVRRGHAGRGIGSQLYGRLLEILAAQAFQSCFGGIALPNEASVALHERMGFRYLGAFESVGYKLGEWRSVGWWRRDLRARDPSPVEPTPFADWQKQSPPLIRD